MQHQETIINNLKSTVPMKSKLKKSLRLGSLLLGISLLIQACQKDDVVIEQKQETSSTQSILQAKDVPHIINYLKQETDGSLKVTVDKIRITKGNNTQVNGKIEQLLQGYIDTNKVLQVENEVTNTKKYTFEVIDSDLETFINLIAIESNSEISSYFIKYIPTKEWLDTAGDLKTFSGTIEVYSYSDDLINTYTLNSGLVLETSSRQSPCADPDVYQNGFPNNPTSTNDSSSSSSSGGGIDLGGNSTVFTPWSTWIYVPFGNSSGGSSGGSGDDNEEIAEDDSDNGSQTGHCDGPNGDGECYCHMLGNRMAQMDLQISISTNPTQPNETEPEEDCTNVGVIMQLSPIYLMDLTQDQTDWLMHIDNNDIYQKISNFLNENGNSDENLEFVSELISLAKSDNSTDFNAFSFVLEAKAQNKIYNEFDYAFLSSVNQFINIDTLDNTNTDPLYIHFMMKCIALKVVHQDWSDTKIYWEASKDLVHLTLDLLGLVPVFGEPADIINGVIYTFEGDALNASLSYVGAIPFVGWLSTGTKISIKVVNQTTQGVIGLVWKVSDSGLITFGNRNILKHVIGSAGTGMHAHHIIPWAKSSKDIIQKAANSASHFNMNSVLNGISLPSTQHLTGHPIYSNKVDEVLDILHYDGMPADEAYDVLEGFINHLTDLLENNQGLNLVQIADLISYP